MFIRSKPTCKILLNIVKTSSVHANEGDNVRHKIKNVHAFMLKHCKSHVEVSKDGQIQVPVVLQHKVVSRLQVKALFREILINRAELNL